MGAEGALELFPGAEEAVEHTLAVAAVDRAALHFVGVLRELDLAAVVQLHLGPRQLAFGQLVVDVARLRQHDAARRQQGLALGAEGVRRVAYGFFDERVEAGF